MTQTLVVQLWNYVCQLLCGIVILFNMGEPSMQTTLIDQLFSCDEIIVYKDGEQINLDTKLVFPELEKLTDKAYFSPAFGVSLHDQTTNALQNGIWIEFCYNNEREYAEMPFSKLLIELKPDYYGFNLIRFNNEKYEGRCFYLNLNVSSTQFYNFIVSAV